MDRTNAPIDPTASLARRVQLYAELAPVGLLQTFFVDQIALGMERLARADAREDHVEPTDKAWVRERERAERTFYRAMAEFRRLVREAAKARKLEASTRVVSKAPTDCPVAARAADRRSVRPPLDPLVGPVPTGLPTTESAGWSRPYPTNNHPQTPPPSLSGITGRGGQLSTIPG